jgi:glycosyltransferase involved in cell wall biosynthesis
MKTRFCIVIPTFNSLATLPAAVESALAQDFDDYRVFVSDNASTDGSADYLLSLSDPRLEVALQTECVGKTPNWNRAFSGAPEAKFFVMLHSDDVLYPGALRTLAAGIERAPGGALYFANHDALSLDGSEVRPRKGWPLRYRLGSRRFDRLQTLLNAVTVVGTVFRADAFRKVGGFDPRYDFYQDMELFHQLGKHGDAVYIPAKVGQYRDTPLRPKNRLAFAIEEARWLQERLGCWPPPLARRIFRLWVDRRYALLAPDVPDLLEDYARAVEALGAPRPVPARNPAVLDQCHRLYKVWCSLTSAK